MNSNRGEIREEPAKDGEAGRDESLIVGRTVPPVRAGLHTLSKPRPFFFFDFTHFVVIGVYLLPIKM
jgi:hypothetical protein